MKNFRLFFLLVMAVLLGSCTGRRPEQEPEISEDLIVVGFSQVGSESDWRNGNTRSMQEALAAENGFRLILDDAQQKQEKQITAIRNFINQGVDYIVLAPTTEQGWDTVLTEARTAGIPVIIVDRMIEVSDPGLFTCWVGSDFYSEGRNAVEWMEQNLPDHLRIVHLQGNIGSSAQIGRTEGLLDGLSRHPEWELVFQAPGDFVQAKGRELLETVLAQKLDFNVIYSENDNMSFGAVESLKEHGLKPGSEITVISFDAGSNALRMLLNGELNLDVECNPMHGPRVRSIIEQIEKGENPPKYTFVDETFFDAASVTDAVIAGRGY